MILYSVKVSRIRIVSQAGPREALAICSEGATALSQQAAFRD
jgi:hypothetical protein